MERKKKTTSHCIVSSSYIFDFYFQISELWVYILTESQQVSCLEGRYHFSVSDQITYLAINHLIKSVVCTLYVLT